VGRLGAQEPRGVPDGPADRGRPRGEAAGRLLPDAVRRRADGGWAGAERGAAVGKLWDELKSLAEDLAPPEERTARVQVEQSARVVLRPENEFKPEVGLTFHLMPRGGALAAVTEADRDRMAQLEKRLISFGVKQGRA